MLRRIALTAVLGSVLIVPSSSVAATDLGSVAASPVAAGCTTDAATVFGGGVPYTVATPGVLTAMRTRFAGPQGALIAFRVMRPIDHRWSGVATVSATLGASGEATTATRVPVQTGDVLGLSKPTGDATSCTVPGVGATLFRTGVVQPDGMAFTPDAVKDELPNVAATLEPDADRDGFGDETQDQCPTDPVVTGAPCLADLRVGIEELRREALIDLGDERGIVATVENGAVSPAAGVIVTSKVNSRIRASSVVTTKGTCTLVPALRCDLGTLAPGQKATIVLLLQGLRTGTGKLQLDAASSTAERTAADNRDSLDVTVVRARTVRVCTVPSVRRLPLRLAKRLIVAAGCDVGRVRRPAARSGSLVVRQQSVRPGRKRPVGTRVGLLLGRA